MPGGYQVSSKQLMRQAQRVAELASARKVDSTRHKCFVSYHVDDLSEVETFLDDFGSEFIPRSVGVTVEDDFIDSDDEDYIKRRIRELYLSDSTVTIVLLGACTWGRQFVDWEISSSLRNDTVNKRSGLLVYPLPSMNNSATLPDRVKDNWIKDNQTASYARYLAYPSSTSKVRDNIEAAFSDRTSKSNLVDNSRALRTTNSCP